MATASRIQLDSRRVEKVVVTYENQPDRIRLDLSLDEALTLVGVCSQ